MVLFCCFVCFFLVDGAAEGDVVAEEAAVGDVGLGDGGADVAHHVHHGGIEVANPAHVEPVVGAFPLDDNLAESLDHGALHATVLEFLHHAEDEPERLAGGAETAVVQEFEDAEPVEFPVQVTDDVVELGNHDEEYDRTRAQMLDIVRSIPYNINTKIDGIHGESNAILTLSSHKSGKICRVFYLFDSNAYSQIDGIKGYDHIRFDQIAWYRKESEKFTRSNEGKPIPSFAFFHIPLLEHKRALQDDFYSETWGTKGELVASANVSSGLFTSMKEMDDIEAIFVGHDHDNDCATLWNRLFFVFGRFSGCDTVYNDLKPNGARVIELTEGEKGFHSWIRLYGGEIIQDLHYPDDFMKRFGVKE